MRQLHLFASKKQRGRSPPPPMEFHTHAALADICKRWINPHWKFTHLPLGENRDHKINREDRQTLLADRRAVEADGRNAWLAGFYFCRPQRAGVLAGA
jgi:hypothetical protein